MSYNTFEIFVGPSGAVVGKTRDPDVLMIKQKREMDHSSTGNAAENHIGILEAGGEPQREELIQKGWGDILELTKPFKKRGQARQWRFGMVRGTAVRTM